MTRMFFGPFTIIVRMKVMLQREKLLLLAMAWSFFSLVGFSLRHTTTVLKRLPSEDNDPDPWGMSNLSAFSVHSGARRQAIMICITGQVQRLILKKKIATLLEPLEKAGYIVDIALVLSEGQPKFTNVLEVKGSRPEWYSFREASKFLRDAGYHVLLNSPTKVARSPAVPELYVRQLNNKTGYRNLYQQQHRAQNHARQFEKLAKCHDALLNATNNAGYSYDLIIRVRDDVAFEPPLDISRLLPVLSSHNNSATILTSDCRMWGGINDRFAVLTPDIASSFFQAPHERFSRVIRDGNENLEGIRNPETYLLDTYRKSNVTVLVTPEFPHVIKYATDALGRAVKPVKEFETLCWSGPYGEDIFQDWMVEFKKKHSSRLR